MGRPRKDATAEEYVPIATIDAVNSGAIPSSDLPALLAEAKAAEDAPLIAAILAKCNG